MTMRLSEQGVRKIDAFWANEMGCAPEDFCKAGVWVTKREASDTTYAHVFRRLARLQVDCSPALYGDALSAVQGREVEEVFDPAFWQEALGVRVDRILGPTYLGYKDIADEGPIDPQVRLLGADEGALLDHLRRGVASLEWEQMGLENCRLIAGYFLDGALVAAAGYKVWGGTLAHIYVITQVGFRSRGFGRACVRSITEEAINSGLVAQYQALFENEPSVAVARALEFEEYGQRIFVRCKAA
jgi:ribosomal protein S18 acetylase RimI-like enzyme